MSGGREANRVAAYARVRATLSTSAPPGPPSGRLIAGDAEREMAMRTFVEAAWRELAPTGVSWIGFYVGEPAAASAGAAESAEFTDTTVDPAPERLVLAAREPKPACSPIGMHGACGQCVRSRRPLVVRDVAELGANYVACDPRDRSELVLPCLDERGRAWGVLDLDSHELAAFDDSDAAALGDLLRAAGLSR